MTIAILIMVLVNTAVIVYLATVIFKIRDEVKSYYPTLMNIMDEQRDVLQGTLDSTNRWCDIGQDIIDHIVRVEDMEGDIKNIFEWIHSVDHNVADMRLDIREIDTKLGDLMAVYDRNVLTFFNDLQSLQKDIKEANEKLDKIDKVTGRYKDTNTNLLWDLIDLNKIYGKSNIQFTTYGLEPDDQKRENDTNRRIE